MLTLEPLIAFVHEPLLHLAGGPITLESLVTGLLIVSCSYVLAGFAGRTTSRLLVSREVAHGVQFALAKIVRYGVILLGIVVALSSVGIHLEALLAASTVLLVGIGFGLQNIAQNFVSGLILLIERPVARGDFVQIGQAFGSVMDVGMRATRVVTRDEVTIIVPNSELITAQVINHSVPTTNMRIAVRVGVAYGTDPLQVKNTLLAVAGADTALLADPAPAVRFEDFGDSTLDFSLLIWIANPRDDLRAASGLRFAIHTAFQQAGIELPFPQRDIQHQVLARVTECPASQEKLMTSRSVILAGTVAVLACGPQSSASPAARQDHPASADPSLSGGPAVMLASVIAGAGDHEADFRCVLEADAKACEGASDETFVVQATELSCEESDVAVGSFHCELTFLLGGEPVQRSLTGHLAFEVFSALLDAGLTTEGAMGRLVVGPVAPAALST